MKTVIERLCFFDQVNSSFETKLPFVERKLSKKYEKFVHPMYFSQACGVPGNALFALFSALAFINLTKFYPFDRANT